MISDIYNFKFVIDETPYCLWTGAKGEILRFLNNIDPNYFAHVGEVYQPMLSKDNKTKQYAAIALKTTYAHGLESFFALLCSAIQAPHCTAGWLLKYRNEELNRLIKKINSNEDVLTFAVFEKVDWDSIAKYVFQCGDQKRRDFLVDNFGNLWEHFASDFLDSKANSEYNNIKHGLRVGMGGTQLSIGPVTEIGKPTPEEEMHHFEKSDFGTSFYEVERLKPGDKTNIQLLRHSLNWNPINHLFGLQLISQSIHNVLVFLKHVNGVQNKKLEYLFYEDEDFYKRPWEKTVSVPSISFNQRDTLASVELAAKEDILSYYANPNRSTI
jgi:hypothetical protein